MRCPYRKKVKVYPDGLGRVSEVEFMECEREDCPYWGITKSEKVHRQEGGHTTYERSGCRKVEKECIWLVENSLSRENRLSAL